MTKLVKHGWQGEALTGSNSELGGAMAVEGSVEEAGQGSVSPSRRGRHVNVGG